MKMEGGREGGSEESVGECVFRDLVVFFLTTVSL